MQSCYESKSSFQSLEKRYQNKYQYPTKRSNFVLAFLLCSALVFSNVKVDYGLSLGHMSTLLSIVVSFFYCSKKDLEKSFLLSFLILFSAIYTVLSFNALLVFFYKILSFLPVIVLARRASVKEIYIGSLYAFLISTILALIFIILGLSEHKFILYYANIPRFAAFTIEPGGYALTSLGLYFLYLFSVGGERSRFISAIYYIPILAAASSVLIVKLLSDFFLKINVKIILLIPIFSVILFFVVDNSRIYDSISTRILLYTDIIRSIDFMFFGTGFYSSKDSAGLPGIFRIYVELGAIFFIAFILYVFTYSIKHRFYKNPVLIIGLFLPLITETYGAPFLWLIPLLILTKPRMKLVKY